jgi:hypothetical protein
VDLREPDLCGVTCYYRAVRSALVLAIALLAGCPQQDSGCETDAGCDDSEVCARDHVCVAPSGVHAVTAEWTINNEPASETTCMGLDLHIEFFGATQQNEDSLGFEPVPCPAGRFFVDKLPVRYDRVGLRFAGGGGGDTALFGSDGIAQLNLAL